MKITERKLRQFICEAISGEQFKIPVEWLTKEVLEDIGNAYVSQSLPKTELGGVIWDKLNELGMVSWSEDNPNGTLPSIADLKIEPGSHFHRWIVLDAVNRAEAEPQPDPLSVAAIEATKAWIADPTEGNQRAAYYAHRHVGDAWFADGRDIDEHGVIAPGGGTHNRFDIHRDDLAFGTIAARSVFNLRAAYEYVTERTKYQGVVVGIPREQKFRVLAALDAVGILPAPNL